MAKNKTHKFTKKVTDEEIENLLSAALQGMTYWADEAKIINKDGDEVDVDLFPSEALRNGHSLGIYDAEQETWFTLDNDILLKGLSLTDNLDLENYDMYDAERVVQRALFGKELYA